MHDFVSSLQSQLIVIMTPSTTTMECLAANLRTIHEKGQELGLHINLRKPEIIAKDMSIVQGLLSDLQLKSTEKAVLLGSPLGDEAITTMLKA